MHQWSDPQEVHGAECPYCLEWKFDTDEDFAVSGKCWECEAIEPEPEDEGDEIVGVEPLGINDFFRRIFG